MKISKNTTVKANIDCDVMPSVLSGEAAPAGVCKYNDAICSIQVAIESLALIAKEDRIARDSIANLSVVLMDLKSNC